MLTTWSGARFNPLSLFAANEQGAWYDPSDLSTLFQDSAGTTPVAAVGQPVGKMLDKSGRGNHATQTTAASCPTLQQDASGRYYLSFDGVDDFLVTSNVDFSGTEKMTILAGVRKLSDGGFAMIAELTANGETNDGGFALPASASNGTDRLSFSFVTRGTTTATVVQMRPFPAPVTAVLSASMANSGTLVSDELSLRANGAAAGTLYTQSGPTNNGNYANAPLYIGRRGGASNAFNGRLYSLIVRGALSTATQIAQAERYVNQRTGAY